MEATKFIADWMGSVSSDGLKADIQRGCMSTCHLKAVVRMVSFERLLMTQCGRPEYCAAIWNVILYSSIPILGMSLLKWFALSRFEH